jgi:exodeoxyribonuclease-3
MASRQEPWTKLAHSKKQPGWVAYNPRTMRPQPLGDDTKHMKILSYNVNGVRNVVRSGQFSALAQRENFDVLCLQETHLKASFVVPTSTPLAYSTPYQLFNRS